jgi:hypothetical protein
MTPATPLDILLPKLLEGVDPELIERAAARKPDAPPSVDLLDILCPKGSDPDELLKNRFLCRCGGLLMCGQTGAGKSSFNMQALVLWALGKDCFGIEPSRPLSSLLIQAENDSVDIAEFRDGVFGGLQLNDQEKASLRGRIHVVRENARTATEFVTHTLRPLIDCHRPDLLWIDPALAYLGGESNSQRDVGHFLRNLLNPLLTEYRCAAVVVHHSNKPPSGQQKPQWQAGDYAYLGGGSAEWANWARAVLVIRSIGSEEIFELRAAKRGRRLQWTDKAGNFTSHKFIAWSKDRDTIFWREPDPEETAEFESTGKPGRPRKLDDVDLLHCIAANPGKNQSFLIELIKTQIKDCGETTIKDAIKAAEKAHLIRFQSMASGKSYVLTDEGRKLISTRPSQIVWKSEVGNPLFESDF